MSMLARPLQRLQLVRGHLSRPSLQLNSSSVPRRCFTSATPPPPSASSTAKSSSANQRWSYFIGTAFHGKPKEPEERNDRRRQKPARLLQGFAADSPIAQWRDASLVGNPQGAGHDWFFVEPIPSAQSDEPDASGSQQNGVVIGIADGVGGWEDSGVDPSHFSQALMYYASQAVKLGRAVEPLEVLVQGYAGVKAEKGVAAGSSTACILSLSDQGLLQAANLGDSTFILVRNSKVVHAQLAQTHYFNAPRQLSKLPASSNSDGNFLDAPEDSDLVQLQLETDDILILTTDGFSDNVWNNELEQLITLILTDGAKLGPSELVDKIAATCCNFARLCSFKTNKESPFEAEARKHNLDYRGGKVDDVCVVAVLVK